MTDDRFTPGWARPDLPARNEERIDALEKRLSHMEESLLFRLGQMETSIKATINGRIAQIEERYGWVKTVVAAAIAMILVAFMGGLVAWLIGIPMRGLPTLPQPYSVMPR